MIYKRWSISKFSTAPFGLKLSTNTAILPVVMFNTWDGLEITIGWWTWGLVFSRTPKEQEK